jgi:hypothetical protein
MPDKQLKPVPVDIAGGDGTRERDGERVAVLMHLGEGFADVFGRVGADRGGVEDEPDRSQ